MLKPNVEESETTLQSILQLRLGLQASAKRHAHRDLSPFYSTSERSQREYWLTGMLPAVERSRDLFDTWK